MVLESWRSQRGRIHGYNKNTLFMCRRFSNGQFKIFFKKEYENISVVYTHPCHTPNEEAEPLILFCCSSPSQTWMCPTVLRTQLGGKYLYWNHTFSEGKADTFQILYRFWTTITNWQLQNEQNLIYFRSQSGTTLMTTDL